MNGDNCRASVAPIYFGKHQDCVAAKTVAVQTMARLSDPDADLLWLSIDCKEVRRGTA
jgi:hypothetical protein|tara:strand:+ start:891 stop:1064 length:174 start_codon:yes stop_codon:yes gene_type:complete